MAASSASGSASVSSANKSAIDDPSSPHFLHHSDSLGLVLVSQQLTGDNYSSWSRAMIIALSVKNKIGFIDGSIMKPEGNDLNLLNFWVKNNHMVISWILNSVSKEISASIISQNLLMRFGLISRIASNRVMDRESSSFIVI